MGEEEDLIKAFRSFDTKKDGRVTVEIFKFVLTQLGDAMTVSEVDELVQEADSYGDGSVDYVHFVQDVLMK